MSGLVFAPMIPLAWLWALAAASGLVALSMIIRSPVGGLFRLAALAGLLVLLAQPRLLQETTTPLPDIALIVTDTSASQELDGRDAVTAEAVEVLRQRLANLPDIEVREVNVDGRQETRLGEAISSGLADVPRGQLSGVFVVTDGQSADDIPTARSLGITAPVHLMLTGREDEQDRVVEILSAPRFGIVNEEAEIRFKVADYGFDGGNANVYLRVNGEEVVSRTVQVGEELTLTAPLPRPGKTVIELIADSVDGELTTRNNRAVIQISVIRDRLRVLLVSGEPHAGERVWRNLLKSDPAVDLIHFTILKPATKPRVAPVEDLALIRFPENELFLEKLDQFDVLIFDRYTYRGVMSPLHFDNISRYVENGGAMLIASGPEFIGESSLAGRRNLAYILPALPNGEIGNEPFVPMLSDDGQRHPVTATLDDAGDWGRWLRVIGVTPRAGRTLMETPSGAPLMILDRVGDGRVGLLLSDHVWLWARNFDGGGPHREMLRRLVHWLMKEPELEEDSVILAADAENGRISISRRTMEDAVEPVALRLPSEESVTLDLEEDGPGEWSAIYEGAEPGLYTVTTEAADGRSLFDVTALGLAAPPEFARVLATDDYLAPLVEASGGGLYSVRQGEDTVRVPSIRQVREGRPASGRGSDSGWAGIIDRDAERLDSVSARPLAPAWLWLALIGGLLVIGWLLEGRASLFRRPSPVTD
ncbi:hypothetical protein [Aquisalinus flavus]|uniref:Membrane protein n=1 Tax=Aquisalinus flavus TaxID=1526572 RepID=A0A8J2Y5Y7_9PROT|nr:hypothetical protein [Aquisalinus flavus]MBD0426843.1 hypothetical protein [Aquisalinus flavus]UNE46690.1 hypothetical protein FF099_00765 [Aquisalinus flavus]GGC96428.1 membrane protein [Aquisalinus flavus]